MAQLFGHWASPGKAAVPAASQETDRKRIFWAPEDWGTGVALVFARLSAAAAHFAPCIA